VPNPRSDADQLARSPIKVTLGDRVYDLPCLRVKAAHDWRKKLVEALAPVVGAFDPAKSATQNSISEGLTGALINFPEIVADLIFAYAGDALKKDEIEAEATDEQLAAAFAAIMQVAYPFLPSMKTATSAAMASTRNPQPTARFTN